MDRTTFKLGAVAGVAMFIVVACSSSDATPSPTVAATPSPTAAEATAKPADRTLEPADDGGVGTGNATGGASGRGTATLTIGDESYSFDGIFCTFSPEEARNDRVSFSMLAASTIDGTRVQMGAGIQDTQEQGRYEGEGTIHIVSLDDIEDFENPTIAWKALSGFIGEPEWVVTVEGKSVSVVADFDDGRTDDIEAIAGTLEATCP